MVKAIDLNGILASRGDSLLDIYFLRKRRFEPCRCRFGCLGFFLDCVAVHQYVRHENNPEVLFWPVEVEVEGGVSGEM